MLTIIIVEKMIKDSLKILAIAGSLRKTASSGAIIRAASSIVPAYIDFEIYEDLGSLPPFDDSDDAPAPVIEFRKRLAHADGIFICTPEYAFGVPGILKNALDWTVASGEFVSKPVAVVSAATGGDKALASLLLTFTALSAVVDNNATLLIPFVRSKLNSQGAIIDLVTKNALQSVVDKLIAVIKTSQA